MHTLERLACEIRIANGTHRTALLDPVEDPETMLLAALAVSFALHGIVDTKELIVTRYAAEQGVVAFATLIITADATRCAAQSRTGITALPVPLLAASVWVPHEQAGAALEILAGLGDVAEPQRAGSLALLRVELPLEQYAKGSAV
jgi:hypothetical protein